MSAYHDVIGYTFEADVYCDPCTAEVYGRCDCDQQDVHGEDSDGNEISPIFAGEVEGDLFCASCGGPLEA